MFTSIVFVGLCLLLFLSGGTVLYMGVFRAHRYEVSRGRKAICGIASYGISGVAWLFMYSFTYLGW